MKLTKGERIGDIRLDISHDPYWKDIFHDAAPVLSDLHFSVDFAQTLDGHYILRKAELECTFSSETAPMQSGVKTRHQLTAEQLTAIMGVVAETDARVVDVLYKMLT